MPKPVRPPGCNSILFNHLTRRVALNKMETATSKKPSKLLPSNAYTKLEPGHEYRPIVPAEDRRAEVTVWSVTLGLIMVVVFTAACVYMALRAANAIEAAIPIAIMAIFFGRKGLKRSGKSTILENVMVQSIGQAAGVVAAGAAFIIPAFYINQLDVHWWQIFLACAIGGFLGIVLIIPLRKYFVKELHGDLPFPEATAINEILVSGESTSNCRRQGAARGLRPRCGLRLRCGGDQCLEPDDDDQDAPRRPRREDVGPPLRLVDERYCGVFGMGYVIGLRYAAVDCRGSVFGYLVLSPLIYHFGSQIPDFAYAGNHYVIAKMTSKESSPSSSDRSASAPLLSRPSSVSSAWARSFWAPSRWASRGSRAVTWKPRRARRPIYLRATCCSIQFGSTLLMAILFFVVGMTSPGAGFSVGQSVLYAAVGAMVGFILSFLFTPVAAQGIAIVGINPVSGMTLITVVLTILALVARLLRVRAGCSSR